MAKSFDITDHYSVEQAVTIFQMLYKYREKTAIAYHSNWYLVIACVDESMCAHVEKQLKRLGYKDLEIRTGKKHYSRYYIRLKFHRRD